MTAIIVVAVLALCIALIIAIAHDNGPPPGEVAVSYELAWDRLDFDVLWTLSAAELRDGLDRQGFVAAKRAAYEQQRALRGLVEHVAIDDVSVTSGKEAAVVTTRVGLHDGNVIRNLVQLVRRSSRLAGRRVHARTDVLVGRSSSTSGPRDPSVLRRLGLELAVHEVDADPPLGLPVVEPHLDSRRAVVVHLLGVSGRGRARAQ